MIKSNFNIEYWGTLPAESIPGNNVFPGDELFSILPKGARILDIGCGSGLIAESLAEKGYTVTAIDINKDTIQKNLEKKSAVAYLLASSTKLPFLDKTFDAVIFGFVLVNLVDKKQREKTIHEVSRVLTPSGIVWLNEGIVSEEYHHRYTVSQKVIGELHAFFVFKEKGLSDAITTEEDLHRAIKNNQIDRLSKHYTPQELYTLFSGYTPLQEDIIAVSSPRSKSTIQSIRLILQKENQ